MAEEAPQEPTPETNPQEPAPEKIAKEAERAPEGVADPLEAVSPEPASPKPAPSSEVKSRQELDLETFRAEFEQLPAIDLGELEKFVDRYDDVPMRVSIELGRVTKTLHDIIEWKEGSIVETKKLSGMPMEIMVNGSLFGHGEVVVVGDNLAIRITDLEKPNLD